MTRTVRFKVLMDLPPKMRLEEAAHFITTAVQLYAERHDLFLIQETVQTSVVRGAENDF